MPLCAVGGQEILCLSAEGRGGVPPAPGVDGCRAETSSLESV